MKKPIIFLLLAIFCLSCKEDEAPVVILNGDYVNTVKSETEQLTEMTFMRFRSNGDLTVSYYRQVVPEGGNCLNTVRKGTYRIVGDEFTFTVLETLRPDPAAFDLNGECLTTAQLVNLQGSDPILLKGTLKQSDSKLNFDLTYNCEPQNYCPELSFNQVIE
ncbi:hypothetical protein [Algoriphagus halophytocola]|uniref:Lipocalin-like domain-containing protein n=1 Tax=Algoriphagus halophytocola TaxID=2991499 RepID=A0ABY6MFQ6_9BACT|nr:hypothetical protein [Algoriphagus sp. TR-M5]UZD21790.1 hypothetical protein OM944_14075 [Algoriphagus sp. TR-M5]